jgi:hypothetical protein
MWPHVPLHEEPTVFYDERLDFVTNPEEKTKTRWNAIIFSQKGRHMGLILTALKRATIFSSRACDMRLA